jgi:hypothetical protein
MARVVLDALGEADLGQHLEVEAGALLQPLRFDQLVFLAEEFQALGSSSLMVSMARSTERGVT